MTVLDGIKKNACVLFHTSRDRKVLDTNMGAVVEVKHLSVDAPPIFCVCLETSPRG